MNTRRATALFGGISLLSIAARLLQLQGLHPLVWDEIEFFRATDWVRQGLVPYRDFWEHHAPLQWFLFAPCTALSGSPGVAAVLLMRVWQLPLWIVTIVLVARAIRRVGFDRFTQWAVVALLLLDGPFTFQAMEFRIDGLS